MNIDLACGMVMLALAIAGTVSGSWILASICGLYALIWLVRGVVRGDHPEPDETKEQTP